MQRRFPHRFQALASRIFVQLCQLLTTMPLSRTETNITKGIKKKDLRGFPTAISLERSRRNLQQSPSFETGSGGWAKDNHQGDWHCRHCLNQNNARRFRPLAELHVSLQDVSTLAEYHVSRLPRAPRARLVLTGVLPLRRPCLQQHLLPRLTAFPCGNLCCRRGGLWKGVHSGENCILVYDAKMVPPPVSGSCEPYFRPNSVSC